jgi:hypothetical protein
MTVVCLSDCFTPLQPLHLALSLPLTTTMSTGRDDEDDKEGKSFALMSRKVGKSCKC